MGLLRNLNPNPKVDAAVTGYSSSPTGYARTTTAAAAHVVTWSAEDGAHESGGADFTDVYRFSDVMESGDLRIVMFSISNETIATPAGWTLIDSAVIATTRRIYWFRRTYAGVSEPLFTTFTFSDFTNYSMTQFVVRGQNATPIDAAVVYDSNTSGASVTAPTATSATAGSIAVTAHLKMATSSSVTMSLPTGMTPISTGAGDGTNGHAYRVAFEPLGASSTATGARTSTSSNSTFPWGASTLLIRSDVSGSALTETWAFSGTAAADVDTPRAAVVAGSSYVYSVNVGARAAQSFSALVNYYNAPSGGTLVGSVAAVAQPSMLLGDVQRVVLGPYTAPTGATYAQLRLQGVDVGGVRVTSVRVSPSTGDLTSDSTYFDGDTAGASWDGTAELSTSSYRSFVETFTLGETFSKVSTAIGPYYEDSAVLGETWSAVSTGSITDALTVIDGFLVASLAFDETRGRVRVEAFTFPDTVTAMQVRSRVPGRTTWTDVRGGLVPVIGGLPIRPVDDYEYAAGRLTEYLIQGLAADGSVLSQSVVTRSGTNDRPWIKFIAAPSSNHPIDLMDWDSLSRDSRTAVYDVIGRPDPIIVSDVHSSRRTTIRVVCHSIEAADELDASLSQGIPAYLQVPAEIQLPSMYVTFGDYSWERPARRSHRSIFTIPITEVSAPPATIAGQFTTWASVLAGYTTWESIMDTVTSWRGLAV